MPFEKGDAQFIASTVWGTVLSLTPEDKKAKVRTAIRQACQKTWDGTKQKKQSRENPQKTR